MSFWLSPSPRIDLRMEFSGAADASGNFEGEWIDTSDVLDVRIAVKFWDNTSATPTVKVQEGVYNPNKGGEAEIIREHSLALSGKRTFAELKLTGRLVRLFITGCDSNGQVHYVVRKVA